MRPISAVASANMASDVKSKGQWSPFLRKMTSMLAEKRITYNPKLHEERMHIEYRPIRTIEERFELCEKVHFSGL